MTNAPLDLSQLALDRSPVVQPSKSRPRGRSWLTRYVLPIGILVGFAGLLGVAAGRGLLPRPDVKVIPVIVKRAVAQQAGTALFQAPGWIEPRPTAISVAALAPGVIEELLVVEGQFVERGEPVARLIMIDAELNVEQAKTSLAIRESELSGAKSELEAARIRFNNPVHLQAPLADARSVLAKSKTELAKLPFLVRSAEAQFEYALSSMNGKRSAQGAIADRIISLAESDHASAEANLMELRERAPNLQREVDALTDKVDALQQERELLIEESRQIEATTAKVQSAKALVDEAQLNLRKAELRLQRNVVRAPVSGRVLGLVAAPGTTVMGLDTMAGKSSSTVVEMYQPNRLQVRADVRLEDVPLVIRGQQVEVETASSNDVIMGRVLQSTSSANIQKNTLEVKVELIDPPATVSPEMLVTTTFLSPLSEQSGDTSAATERLFIPKSIVHTGDSGAVVWIVDDGATAQRRDVELGNEAADGLVEIISGLRVTDKLITTGSAGLKPGSPVHVVGEDLTLGVN